MINSRSCDLCEVPLDNVAIRLDESRGQITLLSRDRWTIRSAAGGRRVRTICEPCSQYVEAAIQHLSGLVRPASEEPRPASATAVGQ